jgi:hypothetical protein
MHPDFSLLSTVPASRYSTPDCGYVRIVGYLALLEPRRHHWNG